MNDFPHVAPPSDGLQRAFADARGRRLRKAGLSTSTVATGLAVLALVAGGQGTQSLVQQPSPQQPAVSRLLPEEHDALPSAPRPNQGQSVQDFGTAAQHRGTAAGPAAPVAGTSPAGTRPVGKRPAPSTSARPPYRAGAITRYENNPVPSDTSCAVPSTVKDATGLCTTAYLTGGANRFSMTGSICSNSTSLTLLHYRGTNEVDVRLTSKSGAEVWRWSRWHPDDTVPHTYGLEARTCTDWTLDWTGVDSQGRRLPKGEYTLQVVFLAKELTTQRVASYPFTLS